MGIIYKITSPSGKIYVGKTYDINKRLSDYRYKRFNSKKSIIRDSVNKYGWDNHIFEVIEECDESLLNEREIFWIKELDTYLTPNGMNLTKGGDGQRNSWKHDIERVKAAKSRNGVNSPNFGRKLSEETKKIISEKVSIYNRKNGVRPNEVAVMKLLETTRVPIVVYNIEGVFVGEFKSITEASKKLNVNRRTLNDALNGAQFHGGGYIPKRKNSQDYPLQIKVDKSKILIRKRPILCIFQGEPIAEFNTLEKVAENLNLKLYTVKDAFYDGRITRDGYFFIYTDLYAEIEALTA